MYELAELNPSVSDATVYKHIQKLIDAGVVKEVALDSDQRRQGYPWKFYILRGERLFDDIVPALLGRAKFTESVRSVVATAAI